MLLNQREISKPRVDNKFTKYLESELYDGAFRYKEPWLKKWYTYRYMSNGDMWNLDETPQDFAGIINVIETAVTSILAELLVIDTTIKLSSFTLAGVYRADKMQTFLRQEMAHTRFSEEYLKHQFTKIITGGSFYKLGFDEAAMAKVSPDFALDMGESLVDTLPVGKLMIQQIRPELIFPEPNKSELKDCGYVVELERVRLSEIVRRYKLSDGVIEELTRSIITANNSTLFSQIEGAIKSTGHFTGFGRFIQAMPACSMFDRNIWVYRAYIKDDAVMEYDVLVHNESGKHIASMTHSKKKYPAGRIVTWCGSVVLEDVTSPFDFSPAVGHNFPFVYERFMYDSDSRVLWGKGKVESMMPLNIDINFIYSQILSQIGLVGNPQWFIEHGALLDLDEISNKGGSIVTTMPGAVSQGKISRKPGLPPEQGTVGMLGTLIEMFDKQTGRVDVTQGINPKGVNTFRATMALMESANKKMIPMLKCMDIGGQNLGKMCICIIADLYGGIPRVFAVQDKTRTPSLIEYAIEAFNSDKYSYQIEVGSLTSKLKDPSQLNVISLLLQTGGIDGETLIEMLDMENGAELIDRLRSRQEQEAQKQQALLEAQSAAQQQQAVAVEQERGKNMMMQEIMKGRGNGNSNS